jgi:hypothetical protein
LCLLFDPEYEEASIIRLSTSVFAGVSKNSEQLFCTFTQVVSVAFVRRISRVASDRIIPLRRLSLHNRVYLFFCALDNTPLVQLSGRVSLVQVSWITSCRASTKFGPPFFNSSADIVFEPAAALLFQIF